MPAYVFVLEPEPELFFKIKKIKDLAFSLVGNQLYLQDNPHITLCLAKTKPLVLWKKDLAAYFSKKLFSENTITVNDWKIFENDSVTHKVTLLCDLDLNLNFWQEWQSNFVKFIQNYRTGEALIRYNQKNLIENLQKNLLSFGYPFVGSVWLPHLSIASFEKKDFLKVQQALWLLCPRNTYKITRFVVYELEESTEKLTKVWSFPLGGLENVGATKRNCL